MKEILEMSFTRNIFFAMTLMILYGSSVLADDANSKLTLSRVGSVIEERVYPIYVYDYQPKLEVNVKTKISSDTPELVVAQWIEAMRSGNYAAALSFWDEQSKAMIEKRNKELKKTIDSWQAAWLKLYKGRNIYLAHQIKHGSILLIEYEIREPDDRLVTGEAVGLVKEKDKWFLTLKYADHPVIQGWNKKDFRVRRLIKD